MIMSEPTPQMVEEWKAVFELYKSKLYSNKKTACQILNYLKEKYSLIDVTDEMATNGAMKISEIVVLNITQNEPFASKIPVDSALKPKVFIIENTGNGKSLYYRQDDIFKGCRIVVGLEFATSYYMVEASSYLHDELRAFQGLDSDDLTNFFLVWEYIDCLKKFDMLESVIKPMKITEQLLRNPEIEPTNDILAEALGLANGAYVTFTKCLKNHGIDLEYRYYNDGKAWLGKGIYTQIGSRGGQKQITAFWLSIWDGLFKITIYIPEKARIELLNLPLSDETLERIETTKQLGKLKFFPLVFDLSSDELFDEIFMIVNFRKMLK